MIKQQPQQKMSKTTKVSATTNADANVNTPVVDTPTPDATPTPTPDATPTPTPEPAPEQTYDDKLAAAKKAEDEADNVYFDAKKAGKPETELSKLKLAAYKANSDVQKLIREHEAQIESGKKAAERIARAQILDDFLSSIGIDAATLADDKKAVYEDIRTRLMDGVVRKEIHIPAGMTGAKLASQSAPSSNGTSKNDELLGLMEAGKSYDELIGMGYLDGTIRTAAWKGGFNKNRETGAYYKKA